MTTQTSLNKIVLPHGTPVTPEELISYWMDPSNKRVCLVGGIGAGKTTLCDQFKEAYPDSQVIDSQNKHHLSHLLDEISLDTNEPIRIAQDYYPWTALIPGFDYLLLGTSANKHLPPDFVEAISKLQKVDDAWKEFPIFKYRAQ